MNGPDRLIKKERKRGAGRFILRRVLLALGLGFCLLIMAAGGWDVYAAIRDLPPWQMDNLQIGAPSTLYAADGTPFATLGGRNYIPVPQKELTLTVKQAFIAAEDNRFYQHWGVDPRGILRAAWNNLIQGKIVQGGSTITQQLAKNAFLVPGQTLKRKIQEVFLAVQLERHYTKDEILSLYLNRIYFGEGAWGIGAAARTYFDKNVPELTLSEAALLAGLVQAPSYFNPYRNPEAAVDRRNTVLEQMLLCRFITPEQKRQAETEPLHLKRGLAPRTDYPYPDFTDYVIATLEEKYGGSALFRGGLKIYTTLDVRAQRAAEEEVRNKKNFPASVRDVHGLLQPQAAVVLLDPFSGSIRALVGGREHVVNRQLNRAVQARRQPGSAFKPIIAYGPAIEFLGMTPRTTVQDEPVRFGSYAPKNYDGRYRGRITLQDALAYSVNVVAVKLLDRVGLDRAAAFARKLGIRIDPAQEGLSAALGGLHEGVTPLQMAAAYAAFANGGEYIRPVAVTRILQSNGTLLEEVWPVRQRAMRRETAQALSEMLRAAVRYGTGTGARIGTLAAGKTGTSDEGKDIWFCGWVPKMVGVVWMGWDQPRPMPRAYGGKYCARLWRRIILKALDINEVPPPQLPQPPVPTVYGEDQPSVPAVYGEDQPSVPAVYGKETAPTVYGHTYGESAPSSGPAEQPAPPVEPQPQTPRAQEAPAGQRSPSQAPPDLPPDTLPLPPPFPRLSQPLHGTRVTSTISGLLLNRTGSPLSPNPPLMIMVVPPDRKTP